MSELHELDLTRKQPTPEMERYGDAPDETGLITVTPPKDEEE